MYDAANSAFDTTLVVAVFPIYFSSVAAADLQPAAALVLVVDPEERPRIDPRLVAEVLGLTPAESELAVMLSQGKTVRDIATERNCQLCKAPQLNPWRAFVQESGRHLKQENAFRRHAGPLNGTIHARPDNPTARPRIAE